MHCREQCGVKTMRGGVEIAVVLSGYVKYYLTTKKNAALNTTSLILKSNNSDGCLLQSFRVL